MDQASLSAPDIPTFRGSNPKIGNELRKEVYPTAGALK